MEILNNVNLNQPFNHNTILQLKKNSKCKNLDFDEHFQQSLHATRGLINSK